MPYAVDSLAQRLLQGDAQVLGQVMRWISQTLAAPRFWSLRNEWPDLCQDVLSRIIESLLEERFDESRDLRVYVQSIVRYVAFEAMSRMTSSVRNLGTEPTDRASRSDPERAAIHSQLVRRVLDLASDDCREMIRLYFFEELDYAAVAERRGVPVGTVKSRLFRCLQGVSDAMDRSRSLGADVLPLSPPLSPGRMAQGPPATGSWRQGKRGP